MLFMGRKGNIKNRTGNIMYINWVVITNVNMHQAVYLLPLTVYPSIKKNKTKQVSHSEKGPRDEPMNTMWCLLWKLPSQSSL